MITIGLIGGIASGKSTVAQLLAEEGAVVLDADRFAHQALAEPGVLAQLSERWGPGILDADGALDRRQVAKRVFGDSPDAADERRFLEQLVHPRVRAKLKQAIADHAASGGSVAVLDIPLLIEAGWAADCDLVLFVDSDPDQRRARAAQRGWGSGELAQREAAQLPIAEKRLRADHVIDNDGDLESLRRSVEAFWCNEVAPRVSG